MKRDIWLALAGPATPAQAPDMGVTQPADGSRPSQHRPEPARKPRQELPSEPKLQNYEKKITHRSFKLLSVRWLVTQQ